MHMQWCTLPEWAVRWIVALKKTNKTSNDRHFYHDDFMVYNNVLIPLGTAASLKKMSSLYIHYLHEKTKYLSMILLQKHCLNI
jgi:hypothetical protein